MKDEHLCCTKGARMRTQATCGLFPISLLALLLVQNVGVAQDADAILGEWITAEGKARVRISHGEDGYCGTIVWLRDSLKNGSRVLDDKNPEEGLRSRSVIGLTIVWGFSFDGEEDWRGGRVYDPESGNTYHGTMTLADSTTLRLRGYVLLPLLGRTEEWTRWGGTP
jgi:uncharacterized protein (DUF2147 family)